MKAWFLFILGTLAYFDLRYMGREDKEKGFDIVFWLKDNWPELSLALILDVIAMIILMDSDANITVFVAKYLPDGLVLPVKLLVSAGCGLGLGYGVYEFVKKFIKKKSDKAINE